MMMSCRYIDALLRRRGAGRAFASSGSGVQRAAKLPATGSEVPHFPPRLQDMP